MSYVTIPVLLLGLSFLAGMLSLTSISAVIGAQLGARFTATRVRSLTVSRLFALRFCACLSSAPTS